MTFRHERQPQRSRSNTAGDHLLERHGRGADRGADGARRRRHGPAVSRRHHACIAGDAAVGPRPSAFSGSPRRPAESRYNIGRWRRTRPHRHRRPAAATSAVDVGLPPCWAWAPRPQLAWVHHRLLTDPSYASFCDVNQTLSCTNAYASPYGSLAGVPVARARRAVLRGRAAGARPDLAVAGQPRRTPPPTCS